MIVVTGATGQFGRHAVENLIKLGVPAGQIAVAVRSPEKAADLASRGVQVRQADYDRPDTLAAAFTGAPCKLAIPRMHGWSPTTAGAVVTVQANECPSY